MPCVPQSLSSEIHGVSKPLEVRLLYSSSLAAKPSSGRMENDSIHRPLSTRPAQAVRTNCRSPRLRTCAAICSGRPTAASATGAVTGAVTVSSKRVSRRSARTVNALPALSCTEVTSTGVWAACSRSTIKSPLRTSQPRRSPPRPMISTSLAATPGPVLTCRAGNCRPEACAAPLCAPACTENKYTPAGKGSTCTVAVRAFGSTSAIFTP